MTSPVALLYDDSAYLESLGPPRATPGDGPVGLVGRQVAGREFLDAYLGHGDWSELTAVVYTRASADSLSRLCLGHPRARPHPPRIIPMDRFADSFCPAPPAPVLYTPCPPDTSFAWARQERGLTGDHGRTGTFALCGVTHTLCTAGAVRALGDLLTAPYESYDALICT